MSDQSSLNVSEDGEIGRCFPSLLVIPTADRSSRWTPPELLEDELPPQQPKVPKVGACSLQQQQRKRKHILRKERRSSTSLSEGTSHQSTSTLQYTTETDIYSFAIILWQCITKEMPFADLSDEEAVQQVGR